MKMGTLTATVTVMYPSPTDCGGQPVPAPGVVPGAMVVLTELSNPLACAAAAQTWLLAGGHVAPGPTADDVPLAMYAPELMGCSLATRAASCAAVATLIPPQTRAPTCAPPTISTRRSGPMSASSTRLWPMAVRRPGRRDRFTARTLPRPAPRWFAYWCSSCPRGRQPAGRRAAAGR